VCERLFPADTLDGTAVDRLLNILFRRAGGVETFRRAGTVETENPGADRNAEATTDATFLIHNRPFHGNLFLKSWEKIITASCRMSIKREK
jgi:hypothetical protein